MSVQQGDPTKESIVTQHLDNASVLVTGGTGSLGQALVRRLLAGELGTPKRIVVLSRDEAKQHYMRLSYLHRKEATDEVIYDNFRRLLSFRIGDVRDYGTVCGALRGIDVVFNAAALKQVPSCEYFPWEAVSTNVGGPHNLARAVRDLELPIHTVVGISTDKACKPVNVMGMTKALQERLFISANLDVAATRFLCVRYGNVLASRGSVVPLFLEQIAGGGPVTLTSADMTRFLLTLDSAVSTIFAAFRNGRRGEVYIPRIPSARIADLAKVLVAGRAIDVVETGIRPGEKVHEVLISEEEAHRSVPRDGHYVILPMLPELRAAGGDDGPRLEKEYSSADDVMNIGQLTEFLQRNRPEEAVASQGIAC